MEESKPKMGRPQIEIDKKQFEQLCAFQCTEREICDWFGITEKTLTKWCRRTYKKTFSQVLPEKRSKGKISLRRFQFQQAEKNPTMAIWLGKQYLGQTDRVQMQVQEIEDDPLSAALEELTE